MRKDAAGSRTLGLGISALSLSLGFACGSDSEAPQDLTVQGLMVRFDLNAASVWDAPFPGEHLRTPVGGVRLPSFPNPREVRLVERLINLIERDARGFGVSSTVYFPLEDAIQTTGLPSVSESLNPSASVQLVDVDPDSEERGRRFPIRVEFLEDGGPHGTDNMLALLPVQGIPLKEDTLYAAIITRDILDLEGNPLGVPDSLRRLVLLQDGSRLPEGSRTAFLLASSSLAFVGLEPDNVAGMTVFRTDKPTEAFRSYREAILQEDFRLTRPFEVTDRFEDFCVFEAETEIPSYQEGRPPFTGAGGAWNPTVQRREASRLVLSIPRNSSRLALPTALFIRTGGGGDRPLVDRGFRSEAGGEADLPGTGPAQELSKVGFAGLSWDGPHGGARDFGGGDEQFVVFNIGNPDALRDNVRQSALEVSWLIEALSSFSVSDAECGIESASLDEERLALMGHSMGATIAPLAVAYEPRVKALILSGAGGSWMENIIHKQLPIAVRRTAEILLKYDHPDEMRTLNIFDPTLALVQWAGEAADPPLYAHRLLGTEGRRRHVLMFQGILDRYIPPQVANPLSFSGGLDLAGPALEPSFEEEGKLVDARQLDFPVSGNREGTTAVVTQHPEGPIEDGHEIFFQTEGPKAQYRCFLSDFAAGRTPRVPSNDGC